MSVSFLRRRSAFTLVELLVVIGIIALLISILLPALGKARDQAVTIKCLAQMHSIGLVNEMYCADNKGQLFPTNYPSNSAVGATRQDISFILQRYLQNSNSLRLVNSGSMTALDYKQWVCPAADHGQSTNQFPLTYAFNQGVHPLPNYDTSNVLYFWTDPSNNKQYTLKRISQLRRPTDVVQMADGSLSSGAWTTTGQLAYTDSQFSEMWDPNKADLPIDQLGNWSWCPNGDIGGANYHMRYRHNGDKFGNVLFLDGHGGTYRYNDQAHPNVGLRMKNFATGY